MPEKSDQGLVSGRPPVIPAFKDWLQQIEIAAERVREVALLSPLSHMALLEERCGNKVLLKREDLQPVFSFKLRGAYNKIAGIDPDKLADGVVTASAGNHAQGVALAAGRKNIDATIFMPKTTPTIKVDAVRRMGAKVVLKGDTYDDAAKYAMEFCMDAKGTWVSPYDDLDVIAGQASIGVEIDHHAGDDLDMVFVPCGGGGLLAGVASWLSHARPNTKVIGVEAADAACTSAAMRAGKRVVLPEVGLFADGAAVAQVGYIPFEILRQLKNLEMIQVQTEEICAAIKDIYMGTRSIAEPAGALAVAGLNKYVEQHGIRGKSLLAIHSGANLNFDRLRYIAENTELGAHQEALFSVTIAEEPGSFRRFCDLIGKRHVTEFNYRYANEKSAQIFVGIATPDGDRPELMAAIKKAGYKVSDMSNNAIAKRHVRHMVGGRVDIPDEVLYRVQFPERPGALLNFLDTLGTSWNITLFHYRSHAAAYGRVLIGLKVPPTQRPELIKVLDAIGFAYHAETENIAYTDFLGHPDSATMGGN
jgi:threonine dehydratase